MANELRSLTGFLICSNGTVSRGWAYDANGNRTSESGTAPSTCSVSASSNRISSISGALARTYAYDAAGNTLAYSTVTATYNNRGRLQTLANAGNAANYVYDALRRMIESAGSAGTVRYAYDNGGHFCLARGARARGIANLL